MFEMENTIYNLAFSQKKLETIETVTKTSILGEISKNNGFLPYNLLKQLFSFAVIEAKGNQTIPQTKGAELFDEVVAQHGLATVNTKIIEQFQKDLGFLFR